MIIIVATPRHPTHAQYRLMKMSSKRAILHLVIRMQFYRSKDLAIPAPESCFWSAHQVKTQLLFAQLSLTSSRLPVKRDALTKPWQIIGKQLPGRTRLLATCKILSLSTRLGSFIGPATMQISPSLLYRRAWYELWSGITSTCRDLQFSTTLLAFTVQLCSGQWKRWLSAVNLAARCSASIPWCSLKRFSV